VDEFLSVVKSSSNRLLDVPASYCAMRTDGDEIRVLSYGGKWVWDSTFPSETATDNKESCRPTAWTANGAFVRDLNGNKKFQRQTAWFVSTLGDDENDGLTALTPLATDREIQRRLGTNPHLDAKITVTYADAPAGTTNYEASLLPDASLTLVGTPVTTLSGVLITAVQAQVRTAGSEARHAITGSGLGASHVGKLAIIRSGTAANIGASAMILKDETGGKVIVSPFGKAAIGFNGFTAVTPVANVDVIDVITPTTLKVGTIKLKCFSQTAFNGPPAANMFVTDGVTLDGDVDAFGTGSLFIDGVYAQTLRSILKDIQIYGSNSTSITGFNVTGGGATGTVIVNTNGVFFTKTGFLNATLWLRNGGACSLESDTYFQASSVSVFANGVVGSAGASVFDRASTGAVTIAPGGVWQQSGAIPDWGTNNTGFGLNVQSGGCYVYSAKPTINGTLGAGREAKIGGVDTEYGSVPAVTAANNAMIVALA
jgi:hypothetical protein